MVINMTRI